MTEPIFLFLQFLDYLQNQPLVIEVWGKQSGRKVSKVEQPAAKAVSKKTIQNAKDTQNMQPQNTLNIQTSQQTANGGPAIHRTPSLVCTSGGGEGGFRFLFREKYSLIIKTPKEKSQARFQDRCKGRPHFRLVRGWEILR